MTKLNKIYCVSNDSESHDSESHDSESRDSDNSSGKVDMYHVIERPSVFNDTLSWILPFEKLRFTLHNRYLKPVLGRYGYNLCNSIPILLAGDKISLKVTIPKYIFGCSKEYEIIDIFTLIVGSLYIESANHHNTINLVSGSTDPDELNTIELIDNCGWFTFVMAVKLLNRYNDICAIYYSINFSPHLVNTVYSNCNRKKINCTCKNNKYGNVYETVDIDSKTCLEITADSLFTSLMNKIENVFKLITDSAIDMDLSHDDMIYVLDLTTDVPSNMVQMALNDENNISIT